VLNGGEHYALTRGDGSFVFHSIAPGIYSLDVLSVTHHFPQIKLDVASREGGRIRALQYDYPGAPKRSVKHPLTVSPLQPHVFFEKRESVGLHTIYRNPMFMMMALPLFMMFVLPKMMSGMDPEEMKKAQEEMGDNDPSKMMGKLFGGGGGDEESDDE
jgi:hypothetical protein